MLDLNQMICLDKSHLSYVAVNCLTTFERTNLKLRLSFVIRTPSHLIVEDIGVEPMTLCVQGRCSSQLS